MTCAVLELESVTPHSQSCMLNTCRHTEETVSIRYAVCLLVHPVRKHFKDEQLFMAMYDSLGAVWPVDEFIWFMVHISSAGQAVRMQQLWYGQESTLFCALRKKCFILIQCLISSGLVVAESQLIWVDFAQQRERGTTLSQRGRDWFPSVNLKTNMTLANFSL